MSDDSRRETAAVIADRGYQEIKMNTQRDTTGRYKFDENAMCECGHMFGDHRDRRSDGARPGCDSPEDQDCACAAFRPLVAVSR